MKPRVESLSSAECPRRTMPPSPRVPRPSSLAVRGFTMIEIAISLAVIGFALVAIIGILPMGMQTQKNNRQETIINQDMTVFMDAIRNGAQGLDDLTNYVVAITNYYTVFGLTISKGQNWYTYNDSSTTPKLLLDRGHHIVGLLSTPKFVPLLPPKPGAPAAFMSNHVVAYVRSISGPAAEKAPANYTAGVNPVQDMAFNLGFNYRMVSDVIPYFGYFSNGIAFGPGVPAVPPGFGRDYARLSGNLQTNLHDLRLTFLWPLLANGSAGPGFQVFRTAASGPLTWTNEFTPAASWPTPPVQNLLPTTLFFFQPRTYLQVQTP
jgi:type II secretory pathway pseudopilin PulG